MKYAVIRTGGKQYRVSEGDVLSIERVKAENSAITFDQVLLYTADGVTKVGTPTVSGVSITGKVLGEEKGEKIRVSKYKAKVRYRKVRGHRQSLSKIQIESISLGKKEPATAAKAASSSAKASKSTRKK